MRLLSIQGLQKKSKPALLRYIIKHLRRKSKKHLVMLAYNISKSKLPRLRTTKQKALKFRPESVRQHIQRERTTKRKFSKKQLAAQRLFAKRARAGTLRRRRR